MDDPDLRRALGHHFLGEIGEILHRELAGLDHRRQAVDERLVLADLPEHVLVVEEHADLGILWDRMDLALVLRRLPEHGDHVGEGPGILRNEAVELHRVARLGELADPFMRRDIDVGPLVDRECLEDVERIRVVARGRALEHGDLHHLVGAGRLQRRIQRLGGGHDIAGTQRPRAVGASPELDDDVFGIAGRGGAEDRGPRQHGRSKNMQATHWHSPFVRLINPVDDSLHVGRAR